MNELLTALATVITTLLTVGGVYLTARRMGRLGVGPAQSKLVDTLTDLTAAYETRIEVLEADVARLTSENADLRTAGERRRRENIDLKQDIDDLRSEVRRLRRKPSVAVNPEDAT